MWNFWTTTFSGHTPYIFFLTRLRQFPSGRPLCKPGQLAAEWSQGSPSGLVQKSLMFRRIIFHWRQIPGPISFFCLEHIRDANGATTLSRVAQSCEPSHLAHLVGANCCANCWMIQSRLNSAAGRVPVRRTSSLRRSRPPITVSEPVSLTSFPPTASAKLASRSAFPCDAQQASSTAHTRAVPSRDAVTMRRPSGLNAAE